MRWLAPALLYVGLPLVLAEVTEVAPWLAERLLRSAARLLPARHRERYAYEWLGELDAVPGKLFKLFFAIRIALRAPATRRELQHAEPLWVIVGRWLLASILTLAIAMARLASQLMGRLPTAGSKSAVDLHLDAEDGSVTVVEAKSMDSAMQVAVRRRRVVWSYHNGSLPRETPVELLHLSKRTYHCLKKTDLNTIRDLLQLDDPERQLLQIRNFGRSSFQELESQLQEAGWTIERLPEPSP
jgi:hypothetical protein